MVSLSPSSRLLSSSRSFRPCWAPSQVRSWPLASVAEEARGTVPSDRCSRGSPERLQGARVAWPPWSPHCCEGLSYTAPLPRGAHKAVSRTFAPKQPLLWFQQKPEVCTGDAAAMSHCRAVFAVRAALKLHTRGHRNSRPISAFGQRVFHPAREWFRGIKPSATSTYIL